MTNVTIMLLSKNYIAIDNLQYISYVDSLGNIIKLTNFDDFHISNRPTTFVGLSETYSLKTNKDIDFIKFDKLSN